jgi:hypothetical protein
MTSFLQLKAMKDAAEPENANVERAHCALTEATFGKKARVTSPGLSCL